MIDVQVKEPGGDEQELFLTRAAFSGCQFPDRHRHSPWVAPLLWQPTRYITLKSGIEICWKHKAYIFHLFSKFIFLMASCSDSTWNIYLSFKKIIKTYSPFLRFWTSFCDWNGNSPSNGFHAFQTIRLFFQREKGEDIALGGFLWS